MKKSINICILMMLLFFFIVFISGCNSVMLTQEYKYDDRKYSVGDVPCSELITTIRIDWLIGDIIIEKSKNRDIVIKEEIDKDIDDSLKMHYRLQNNTLDIKFCGNTPAINYKYKTKKLYIAMPSSDIYNYTIVVNSHDADVTVRGIDIRGLSIHNNTGNIKVTNVVLEDLAIDNKSGKVNLKAINSECIDIDSDDGLINLSYTKVPRTARIYSKTGIVTIYASEKDSVGFQIFTPDNKVITNLDLVMGFDNSAYLNRGRVVFYIKVEDTVVRILEK